MKLKHYLPLVVILGVGALTAACSNNDSSPTSPSEFTTIPGTATFTAPAPDSPADAAQLDTLRPTLTVTNGSSNAPSNLPRTYEFQISDTSDFSASQASFSMAYKIVVSQGNIPEGSGGKTSFTPSSDLQPGARLYWRARMIQVGQASPWSTVRTFRTKNAGYIRGGELYDPLTQGTTVGRVVGSVTWHQDVGVELDNDRTYVEYTMPETVTEGEYSVLLTNLGVISSTEDPKYRVISMREGTGQFNDNIYRMSVEKRGNGAVAWRFITGTSSYIETVGSERVALNMHESLVYFYQATWRGNFFNVLIRENGEDGTTLYNFGKPYKGIYQPLPHNVYLGSPWAPGDRGEPASCEGMIARQVWVSRNPRPAGLK